MFMIPMNYYLKQMQKSESLDEWLKFYNAYWNQMARQSFFATTAAFEKFFEKMSQFKLPE